MIYFVAGFFILGLAFMTWKVVQLWRNPAMVDFFTSSFSFLPFGPDVRRGEIRSLAVMVTGLWAVSALIVVGLRNGEFNDGLAVTVLVASLVVMACLVTEVCVILFNRPRFVVPPHMRSELGVVAARRARRSTGERGRHAAGRDPRAREGCSPSG
ncbi:hypothetical protein E0500_002535 [Streptomyces sp. KM273126]|uniref:hypothetical protein n=1 Tax=Streptomyces sp. KM273126 TaxID=2545247 RepID=UPI00103C1BB5|nr:hypothetical protein [Streptomyces sp. KM273126]MBA2806363.1 hypothetical protein [Streptomyces sp. KM273126]